MVYADRIGAHYVTWLVPDEFENLDGDWRKDCAVRPQRGLYDVRDEEVIARHAEWSLDHGLNWWWMSWWGEDHVSDEVFDSFLTADTGEIEFSVLFESAGLLDWDDGVADLDDSANRERLVDYFRYFDERFFDAPNYGRVDGRPVIFLFSSLAYEGDLAAAFSEATEAIDADPYLIGDEVVNFGSTDDWTGPDAEDRKRLDAFDAVTTYASWKPREDIDDVDFVGRVMDAYAEWAAACENHESAFIPQVMPGYDDTQITHVPGRDPHPVLSRDPERFAEMCDRARAFLDDEISTAFITSFNEWFEGSAVEPSEEEGLTYLEVVDEHLASN